jgi:glycosyltransferase involved in cell wall biosynthesis
MSLTYGIVTATLNVRRTVLETVRSALSQGRAPAEYIVVDGGSTDGTVEAVEAEFARLRALGCRTELRVIRQSGPPGIAHAWNEAIALLSCDIVYLANGDDWIEAGAAARVMREYDRDPRLDIVHGNARFHGQQGEELGVLAPCWVNHLGVQSRTLHCATFVRRSVYREVGGFDPAFRTTLDYDFLERCWRAGRRFRHIDAVLSNFRLGGISNTFRSQADLETLRVGLRHSRTKVLPVMAFLVRRLLLRPTGIAGFDLWMRREATPAEPVAPSEPAKPRLERIEA